MKSCRKPRWMMASLVCAAVLIGRAGAAPEAQGVPGGPGPAVDVVSGTYDWGNRFYETAFTDTFEFDNRCDRAVALSFDTRDVPFLSVMPRVVAAPGLSRIPITLTTPAWPDRPECTDLTGELVFTSTGYETDAGECRATEHHYTVTAHVHWWDRPPPPPKLKVAAADACTVWWNTGEPPPSIQGATDAACLDTMRALALAYRDWILDAAQGQPPEWWSWLPSAAQVGAMAVDALLEMKRRADAQLGIVSPRA